MSDSAVSLVERLMSEEILRATAAAKLFPAVRGKRLHATTVVKWITHGKGGVRLEGYRGPGKGWWTSRQAVVRFLAALTAKEIAVANSPTHESAERERKERAERARLETLRLRDEWRQRRARERKKG